MKKTVLTLLLCISINFIFTGCSQKEPQTIFKDKLVCIEQTKTERTKIADIYVEDEDIDIYRNYVGYTNAQLDFYENQVDRNNKFCEEIKKLNESEGK